MHLFPITKLALNSAFEHTALKRAIQIGLASSIVFILLLIIFPNHNWHLNFLSILFAFIIPYSSSTLFTITQATRIKPGKTSHIDALLVCKSCKKTNFHIHIGEQIEACPLCKSKTRWSPLKIFSGSKSDTEMLKSLALFARHNPQPLFRVDEHGIILGSNPASEMLFKSQNLQGENLKILLPKMGEIDFSDLVLEEKTIEMVTQINGFDYKLLIKGVKALATIHVYGNDITEILQAEKKIKSQAQDIQESIQYAWSIQKSILPHNEMVLDIFPKHCIFYKPRNVISGDFYWVGRVNKLKIIAVADSTGHGVPGALMSMLGTTLLNEIILREKITEPHIILNNLRTHLLQSLKTGENEASIQDGMDIAIIVVDSDKNILTFAGAFNPIILIQGNELSVIDADTMPVGRHSNEDTSFTKKELRIISGDRVFLFTDGFKDQFGGENDKKYSFKAFKNLILETSEFPIKKQQLLIQNSFETWKKDTDQIDDVLVVGIQIE